MKAGIATRDGLTRLADSAALYDLHGNQLSGNELLLAVDRLAGALIAKGFAGAKIGLWYRNSFAAVQAFLAAEWVGGTRVTVDPRAPESEVDAVFGAAGVDVILTDRDHSFAGRPVFKHTDAAPLQGEAVFPGLTVDPNKTFIVYPRSVEGGRLFAVSLSYGNWDAIMRTNVDLYRSGRYGPWHEESECFLANQQIMHGTGFVGTFPFLRMGLPQVLVDTFDEHRIIAAIARHRVTATLAVPLMLTRLTDAAKSRPADVTSLRHVLYGGGRTRREEILRSHKELSPNLIQIYGRLEGGWPISILDVADHQSMANGAHNLAESCGRPIDAVTIKLRPLAADDRSSGELCVKSAMCVAEYSGPDGWCASGDIVKVDESGYLHYRGRVDRMINNGFHVYPEEIERAICAVDGVSSARVYGKPDPRYGEIVAADVVVTTGRAKEQVLTDVRLQLERGLAKYKVPRVFNAVQSLSA
jgi:acyl-CoA synthetase (AMP-forming)/AMP-acid ligase II